MTAKICKNHTKPWACHLATIRQCHIQHTPNWALLDANGQKHKKKQKQSNKREQLSQDLIARHMLYGNQSAVHLCREAGSILELRKECSSLALMLLTLQSSA